MVYVFFFQLPHCFQSMTLENTRQGPYKEQILALSPYDSLFNERKTLLLNGNNWCQCPGPDFDAQQCWEKLRSEAKGPVKTNNNASVEENDKDYVFIYFVLSYLPPKGW